MLNDQRPQTVDLMHTKAMGLGKTNRLQPKFRDAVTVFDMYVRRF